MKPENLKSPFSWKERKVLFHDRIWYIPDFIENYQTFSFPGWNHESYFDNENPVNIEYCSGNGAWILEKALTCPNENWVAVEMQFVRARKIWAKIKNHNLSNLIVVCGDGRIATREYFKGESVANIFVNFPDPWPKLRHAKHRIIQASFIDEVARLLKLDGKMVLVTDDEDYSEIMIQEGQNCERFESVYPKPFYSNVLESYGSSFFEELWREKGKEIRYHQFVKRQ